MIYIFDIDGTIANIDHRLPILRSEDPGKWDRFYKACVGDKPIWPILSILKALVIAKHTILFFTSRSDLVEYETREWLEYFTGIPETSLNLYMREYGDHRPDYEIKGDMYMSLLTDGTPRCDIAGVFEDRDQVVKMWRELGVPCFQVADGSY